MTALPSDTLWVSLTYLLDPFGLDYSRSGSFIEFWVNDWRDQSLVRGPGLKLHVVVHSDNALPARAAVELEVGARLKGHASRSTPTSITTSLLRPRVESGRPVNLSKLSQESGVPASTLSTYYQVLEDTFVGYRIGLFGSKICMMRFSLIHSH